MVSQTGPINLEKCLLIRSESEISDVLCKPVFVQTLFDTTINEGDRLRLRAAVNAHPEPEVKTTNDFSIEYFSFKDHLVSK